MYLPPLNCPHGMARQRRHTHSPRGPPRQTTSMQLGGCPTASVWATGSAPESTAARVRDGRPARRAGPELADNRNPSAVRSTRSRSVLGSSSSPTTLTPQLDRKYGGPRCSKASTSPGSAPKRDPEQLILAAEHMGDRRPSDFPAHPDPSTLLGRLRKPGDDQVEATHPGIRDIRSFRFGRHRVQLCTAHRLSPDGR